MKIRIKSSLHRESRIALIKSNMKFHQAPPSLGNQYEDDRVLRSYLARVLPRDVLAEVRESLSEMGRLAGGDLYELQLADRLNEPRLIQWDAWGNRIDKIELTQLWRLAERIAAEHGSWPRLTSRSTAITPACINVRWLISSHLRPTSTVAHWR